MKDFDFEAYEREQAKIAEQVPQMEEDVRAAKERLFGYIQRLQEHPYYQRYRVFSSIDGWIESIRQRSVFRSLPAPEEGQGDDRLFRYQGELDYMDRSSKQSEQFLKTMSDMEAGDVRWEVEKPSMDNLN